MVSLTTEQEIKISTEVQKVKIDAIKIKVKGGSITIPATYDLEKVPKVLHPIILKVIQKHTSVVNL